MSSFIDDDGGDGDGATLRAMPRSEEPSADASLMPPHRLSANRIPFHPAPPPLPAGDGGLEGRGSDGSADRRLGIIARRVLFDLFVRAARVRSYREPRAIPITYLSLNKPTMVLNYSRSARRAYVRACALSV